MSDCCVESEALDRMQRRDRQHGELVEALLRLTSQHESDERHCCSDCGGEWPCQVRREVAELTADDS